MECTSDWKSEYMQLININKHAWLAIYGWKHFYMIEVTLVSTGPPSRVGPNTNCHSCPSLSAALRLLLIIHGEKVSLHQNFTFIVKKLSGLQAFTSFIIFMSKKSPKDFLTIGVEVICDKCESFSQ